MSYNDDTAEPIVIDLETVAMDGVAELLDPVSAPSNYKDAAKIEAAKKEKIAGQIERAALDANLCRIVALGFTMESMAQPTILICKTEAEEKKALQGFWDELMGSGRGVRRTVTFNGLGFDLPVIEQRSRQLGLKIPSFDLRAWGMHLDLMQLLTCNGKMPAHSLKFFCKLYGIQIPVDDAVAAITGADIAALVARNTDLSWALIDGHCDHDIRCTEALAHAVHAL